MKIFSLIYLLIFFMVIPFIVITDTELLIPFIFFTVTVYSIILVIFKLINTKKKTELTMINSKEFWTKVLDEYLSADHIDLHKGSNSFKNIWFVISPSNDTGIENISTNRELKILANLFLDEVDSEREKWLVLPSSINLFTHHPSQLNCSNTMYHFNIRFIRWNEKRLTNNTALTH